MTRNPQLNQQLRDDRRERILAAALALFAARGLFATRISDIARAAAMSQGLLYHYFDSKEAIFSELIRQAFERLNAAAAALEALPLPPREKLERALTGLLASLEGEAFAHSVLLIAQAGLSEAIPDEARAVMASEAPRPYEVIARILRAGQADGSVRPGAPETLSLLFWTTLKGLALHRAAHGSAFKAPDAQLIMPLFFQEEPPPHA